MKKYIYLPVTAFLMGMTSCHSNSEDIHAVKSIADKKGEFLLQDKNGKALKTLDRR